MSTNTPFQTPFLRVQRLFPQEAQPLSVEIDRAYTDIASAVNSRVLGLFTTNSPIQNGETWYYNGLRYQGFRKIFLVTGTGNIPHGINVSNIAGFTQIYGTFSNGATPPTWYPLPYVDVVNANNQVNIVVNSTNIVITAGVGSLPTVSSGYVVLEYISQS